MITKNCSLCGVLIDPNFETCETCFAMLGGAQPSPGIAPVVTFQPESPYQTKIEKVASEIPNLHPQSSLQTAPPVRQSFNQPPPHPAESETEFEFERFPTPPPSMTTAGNDTPPPFSEEHNAEMQAAVQSFVPAGFATLDAVNQPVPSQPAPRTPRYVPPPPRQPVNVVQSEYKPTVWNWIKELPTMAKVAAVVVVFSICFAVALKGFMTMDVSIQPGLGPTEPQTPWFSAWFRANPTAEEILKKYESETQTEGNSAVVQSYLVGGKAQFLFAPPDGTLDIMTYRKKLLKLSDQAAAAPTPEPNPTAANNFPQLWDMDIKFEMAMKNPNKFLMKMALKPQEKFTQSYRGFKTYGFDGDRGWIITKSQVGGRETVDSGELSPRLLIFRRMADGISLGLPAQSYKSTELVGMDVVYGRMVYNVKLTDETGATNALFDIETGLLTKLVRDGEEIFILAHETFNGTKLPSKMIFRIGRSWFYMEIENVQKDVALNDTIFLRSSY